MTWKTSLAFALTVLLLLAWAVSGGYLVWRSWEDGWGRRAVAIGQAIVIWAFVGIGGYLLASFTTAADQEHTGRRS